MFSVLIIINVVSLFVVVVKIEILVVIYLRQNINNNNNNKTDNIMRVFFWLLLLFKIKQTRQQGIFVDFISCFFFAYCFFTHSVFLCLNSNINFLNIYFLFITSRLTIENRRFPTFQLSSHFFFYLIILFLLFFFLTHIIFENVVVSNIDSIMSAFVVWKSLLFIKMFIFLNHIGDVVCIFSPIIITLQPRFFIFIF